MTDLELSVWNLVCGFAKTPAQLIVFRFLAGLGGSAPLAVSVLRNTTIQEQSLSSNKIGAGSISDLWRPEERGYAIALFTLGPLLGPVVGPITGGWIAEKSTWKWVVSFGHLIRYRASTHTTTIFLVLVDEYILWFRSGPRSFVSERK